MEKIINFPQTNGVNIETFFINGFHGTINCLIDSTYCHFTAEYGLYQNILIMLRKNKNILCFDRIIRAIFTDSFASENFTFLIVLDKLKSKMEIKIPKRIIILFG